MKRHDATRPNHTAPIASARRRVNNADVIPALFSAGITSALFSADVIPALNNADVVPALNNANAGLGGRRAAAR